MKQGANTLILGGNSNFVGLTQVTGGAVAVEGSLQGVGVIVNSARRSKGRATSTATCSRRRRRVAAGRRPWDLTVGSLFFDDGGAYVVQIGGTVRGAQYDAVVAAAPSSSAARWTSCSPAVFSRTRGTRSTSWTGKLERHFFDDWPGTSQRGTAVGFFATLHDRGFVR